MHHYVMYRIMAVSRSFPVGLGILLLILCLGACDGDDDDGGGYSGTIEGAARMVMTL
jgi:hypothetical protein